MITSFITQQKYLNVIVRFQLSTYLFSIFLITCFFYPSFSTAQQTKNNVQKKNTCTWVTIFIHGISSTRPHLNIGNIWRFIKNDIADTHYKETVEEIRSKQFCYNGQAMQELGLKKINITQPINADSSRAIATIFDNVDTYAQPKQKNNNDYYTYGWSALVGVKERTYAARDLYNALVSLKNEYAKKNKKIKIRLIGYSHGGKIILALGSLSRAKKAPFVVDEAITLGTPVHLEEHKWIHSPLFKKIYHVYSHADQIQRLDIFTHPGHFGHKHFRDHGKLKLPAHLVQVEIRAIRPMRGSKKNKTNLYHKPAIIMGKSRTLRNMSPGHIELWFFGWADSFYRNDCPFYPLPYITLLPFLLYHARDLVHKNPAQPVVFDIRPYDERMIIRQTSSYTSAKIVPFLPTSMLEKLRVMAYKAKPLDYSYQKQQTRVRKMSHTVRLKRKQRKRRKKQPLNNPLKDVLYSQ